MPYMCCLPGCSNRHPEHHLFSVPNKKFCKKGSNRYFWAEDIEKIVKKFRGDPQINVLFHKNIVKMCEVHFEESDILTKKSRKSLREGAIPKYYLPQKSVEVRQRVYKLPRPRPLHPKRYATNIIDVRKQISSHLKLSWKKYTDNPLVLIKAVESFHQPQYSLTISDELKCSLHYFGWLVSSTVTDNLDLEFRTINQVLTDIEELQPCPCVNFNTEDEKLHKHIITAPGSIEFGPFPRKTTLACRVVSCTVLSSTTGTCKSCSSENMLHVKKQKMRLNYKTAVQNQPLKRISQQSLKERIALTIKDNLQKTKHLEKKVQSLLSNKKSFVSVDRDFSSDFFQLMEDGIVNGDVDEFHAKLWSEQKKLKTRLKGGERYHPEIIRFCLNLACKSTAAYEELRSSGILRLPSSRTLRDYRNVYAARPGLVPEVFEEIASKAKTMQTHEKFVSLSIDEMKIKENLAYDSTLDEIVGFVDLRSHDENTSSSTKVASHCLQFYIKSILSDFSRPLMFFPTKNLDGENLVSLVWNAIGTLQNYGLNVICLIADGMRTNRKMFEYMCNIDGCSYKCRNIYNPSHDIFLIVDPPHLLKTTRNNIFCSRPGGTRMLQRGSDFILWSHFAKVPYLLESYDLRCSKLTENHLRLNSFSKMRVLYAAQTLSQSVSNLMLARGGNEMKSSAWIAALFNKWFDCMNTTLKSTANVNLHPFYSGDDPRLDWLETNFLSQLDDWKSSISGKTKSERDQKFLSAQTYSGLVMTTKSMVELVRFLLRVSPEKTFVLTRRINQDPLEAFFSRIRRVGGSNEAPDVLAYARNQRILSFKKQMKLSRGSNVLCEDE